MEKILKLHLLHMERRQGKVSYPILILKFRTGIKRKDFLRKIIIWLLDGLSRKIIMK